MEKEQHKELNIYGKESERGWSPVWWAFVSALPLLLLVAGCSDSDRAGQASGPAAYGPPTGEPPSVIARARPMEARPGGWSEAPFFCLQTELSPAILFHSSSNYLGCFNGMTDAGLGGPTFAAYAGKTGIQIAKRGEPMEAAMMDECWVLVWFSGAKGWTNWDSPWAVFLQRKPVAMKLDEEGLHFEFAAGAGDVVLLPLYGSLKAPVEGDGTGGGRAGAKSKSKLKTWQWSQAVPKEPLMRVRYWASALREFPVYCEDSFSVDPGRDLVTIRQRFGWRSIEDDWNTPHLKLAPVSPPMALAAQEKRFPVTFSRPVSNLDFLTPHGPYGGVEGKDSYEASFQVLRSVNEMELPGVAATNASPVVRAARERLRAAVLERVGEGRHGANGKGRLETSIGALVGDRWFAKALPYLDEPTRATVLASLRKFFHEEVLVTNRFQVRESPARSGRTHWVLTGVGSAAGGGVADAGKESLRLVETLWAYAHFSGDWELIRERWPLVKGLLSSSAEKRWASYGRVGAGVIEGGDGAASWLAMARMAYRVGDLDAYGYACYLFTREWVQLQGKQTGSPPGILGECLAVIRTSEALTYQRLIPGGPPSPFVAGVEREVAGPNVSLVHTVSPSGSPAAAPALSWPRITGSDWKTPMGAPWTFGEVRPVRSGLPAGLQRFPLNWNSEAVVYRGADKRSP